MNYIKAENYFWKLRRSLHLSSVQADIYQFLLHESSSRGQGENWENPFNCKNGTITTMLGITESTLIRARKVLVSAGLITVEAGVTKQVSPRYYLHDYYNKASNNASIIAGIEPDYLRQSNTQYYNNASIEAHTNTQTETKPNNTYIKKFDHPKFQPGYVPPPLAPKPDIKNPELSETEIAGCVEQLHLWNIVTKDKINHEALRAIFRGFAELHKDNNQQADRAAFIRYFKNHVQIKHTNGSGYDFTKVQVAKVDLEAKNKKFLEEQRRRVLGEGKEVANG